MTDIEEMLIAQIFPVVSVYNLPGGQYTYRGNIINFLQDVQEFVTRLPRDPSSLDLLIVRRYTENGTNFRDFQVRREKVMQALLWLKAKETESFIQRAIGDSDATQVRNSQANINRKTLNNKQRTIFERIERQYIALTSNEYVEPLRIIIIGTANLT